MLKTVSSITNAIGALNFKGTWNAATNTPTIVSGVGVKGDYFVVSVAGSTTIDGISNWGVGDWITYNGTVWQRVEGGADLNGVNLSVSGTTTLSGLTASTALALNASKEMVSVTNTGTNDNVLGTSPTITTPRVVTSLNDTNGNEIFGITATASAVNELTVANAATGNNPVISATGSDTNIGITLAPKGTGGIVFPAGAVGTPAITTTGDLNTGIYFPAADTMAVVVAGAESTRTDSSGNLLVGKTAADNAATVGIQLMKNGVGVFAASSTEVVTINRETDDGRLVGFRQGNLTEGEITVSGNTVSYLGGNLARWAQLLDGSKDESIIKGTVLSNLDDMNVYIKPTLYWTEDDELPVDEEGNPTVAVGDLKQETSVSENEQLNKVKVSNVEGDLNVAGVFVNWTYDDDHQIDEMVMAMTGDMIIRIGEGVTVARGDLLMSAGDGTAKPQGDDIVRSKTIAKVTSTHVSCTYEDGSYCVPCVLMAC